jgi:BirA family biotin operon repressor/biotin-[acetyl-CoA-carboxylase] ligase
MSEPLLNWRAPTLQLSLQAQLDGWGGFEAPAPAGAHQVRRAVDVQAVPETGSTNTDLLEWARLEPAPEGMVKVLSAQRQTAGRGRMGRQWLSAPGSSLTFSIGLAMHPRFGWGALSLALGQAVAEVLQPWADGRPGQAEGHLMLKWPNDLWWFDRSPQSPAQRASGRKLAGILIETLPMADGWRWVVVGLGLNVRAQSLVGPPESAQAMASTYLWRPHDDAVTLWHELVPSMLQALLHFEQRGFDEAWRQAVESRELLVGQPVTMNGGSSSAGQCEGLDADGALLIRVGSSLTRVVAGEVQVRPGSDAS